MIRKGSEKGFSLIEVLIAIFLISLGLLAFTSFINFSVAGVQIAEETTEGTYLAHKIMEDWAGLGRAAVEREGENDIDLMAYDGVDSRNTGTWPPPGQHPQAREKIEEWEEDIQRIEPTPYFTLEVEKDERSAFLDLYHLTLNLDWENKEKQKITVNTVIARDLTRGGENGE